MNRTNEFKHIIFQSNIAQNKSPLIIHKIPNSLTKKSNFFDHSKIFLLQHSPISLQDEKIIESINLEIKRRIKLKTLENQKNKIKHIKETETKKNEERELRKDYVTQEVLMEDNEMIRRNVIEREKIEEQINELGQIMCDISVQVEAQGEKLKRIDDCIDETDDYLKKSYYEINRLWNRIRGRRETMIKFFGFLLLICLILFILKKF
ncbi:Integral membrane protein SED5 [Gurleya vavrai]